MINNRLFYLKICLNMYNIFQLMIINNFRVVLIRVLFWVVCDNFRFDESGVYLWFKVQLLVNVYEYIKRNDISLILFWNV